MERGARIQPDRKGYPSAHENKQALGHLVSCPEASTHGQLPLRACNRLWTDDYVAKAA